MASPRLLALLTLPLLLACPAESQDTRSGSDPTPKADPAPKAAEAAAMRSSAPPDSGPFFMPQAPEDTPRTTDSPLDLTASDGSGLELVSFEAKGVVEGPLAFTELHLVFRNPEPRVREGRFRVTLPEDASISRFAMKIGDRWQEGEVVERQKARRTYEDFLHRRQDPALLEQAAGNEFTARVFPIPANATKELIVSYSHELSDAAEPYRIPLAGLPQVQRLNIEVVVAKHEAAGAATSLGGTTVRHETVRVAKENWVPDRDFEVQAQTPEGQLALRHENLVLARVTPELAAEPDLVHGVMVLVDTSASRALGFSSQVRLLSDLVAGLVRGAGADTPLMVAAFDQEVELIYEGTAGDFGAKAKEALHKRRALGASDLEGALSWAAEAGKQRYDRVLLITDGVATVGDTEGGGVQTAAKALGQAGVKRIDALALGGLRDADALKRIVTAGLDRDGVVLDGALPLPELGRRLSRSTTSGLKVEVDGASWVWPQTLDGVQPGDAVLVYADLPAGRPLRMKIGGHDVNLAADAVLEAPRPLLERAWVRARIQRLIAQRAALAGDPDMGAALKNQIIELSTKYRVLSPFTALLVLETEWDYQRYGIARTALADILTVGGQGIEVLNRALVQPQPTA
ncbi:MAG: VWA domain-containing protein, partial [Myxococcales bacterium]|nr:VWA domain-containing protein [Myxococcales bacterium]